MGGFEYRGGRVRGVDKNSPITDVEWAECNTK